MKKHYFPPGGPGECPTGPGGWEVEEGGGAGRAGEVQGL